MKYKIVELTTPLEFVDLAEGSLLMTSCYEPEHRSWDNKTVIPPLWHLTYLEPLYNTDLATK